jgi:ABC-type multidrug transport system fused ATPase/permease subunit
VRANGIDIHLVIHDTREPVDHAETTEVVVVGAGPTGLTAAIRLAELGVPHMVLDAAAEPTCTSKAALVHASTLELLAELGREGPLCLDQAARRPPPAPAAASRQNMNASRVVPSAPANGTSQQPSTITTLTGDRPSSTRRLRHSVRRGSPRPQPLRPEEDAGFLPRRDGSDQLRCYGAAEAWQLASGSGVGDVLELQGLTRRYGEVVALDDLSFTVAEDQMFGFVGPNGAGKTTAMRIVLGVLEPDAGEVRWRGQPMNSEIRRRVGYLPEDHGQTFL